MSNKLAVGGQAVIEGVMMKTTSGYSTAVRRKDEKIVVQNISHIPWADRKPIFGKPIIRGVVSLIEMLKIGIKTLMFSANIFEDDENSKAKTKAKKGGFWGKVFEALSFVLAIVIGFGVFFYLPYFLTEVLGILRESAFFNIIAGLLRTLFFLGYVFGISFMKDIKRVFQYHGAEHKLVFAYENKKELSPAGAKDFLTFHPRCGTSFIFIVLIVSIILFSILDFTFFKLWGFNPQPLFRLLYHFPFIPFIAGLSYEFLKLSSKRIKNPLILFFITPGLWLQRITTKEPDEAQLEVSAIAIKSALNIELSDAEKAKVVYHSD